ncbi:MAG: hypothetical protein ABSF81_18390 [Bacteroidales bacterium]
MKKTKKPELAGTTSKDPDLKPIRISGRFDMSKFSLKHARKFDKLLIKSHINASIKKIETLVLSNNG